MDFPLRYVITANLDPVGARGHPAMINVPVRDVTCDPFSINRPLTANIEVQILCIQLSCMLEVVRSSNIRIGTIELCNV